jgi:O-antigen ligase
LITNTESSAKLEPLATGEAEKRSRAGRIFLSLMFITLLVDSIPGMGLGIAPGLSAKNLYLYILCLFIGARAVMDPYGLRFADLNVHIPFLIIIGYAFMTLAISSVFDPTYDTLRGITTLKNKQVDLYLLMFIFAYLVSHRDDFLWLIRTVVVVMFISSFVTIIDFLNIPDLGIVGTHKGRIEGPIGSANQYGTLLAFMLPISIATVPKDRLLARWLWRLGILISAVLLIGTGSRGAYVAIVAGSVAGAFFLRDYLDFRVVARVAIASILTAVLLIAAFLVFNPDFLLNLFEKTATGDLETASSGRWAIWGAAFGVMLEAPYSFVVGYGWNTFDSSGIWKSAHSEYVNRYFETGIVGLVAFVFLLWTIIVTARKNLRRADGMTRKLLLAFVFAMFMLSVNVVFVMPYTAWSIIWIIIGLMLGLQATVAGINPGPGEGDRQSNAEQGRRYLSANPASQRLPEGSGGRSAEAAGTSAG